MKRIKSISIYAYPKNKKACLWAKKIEEYIKKKFKHIVINNSHPDAVLVFGGDGTIIEAGKRYLNTNCVFFGFNLGHTGFLASVRDKKTFYKSLDKFLNNKYKTIKRYILKAELIRKNKVIHSCFCLNDIVTQSLVNMARISVSVGKHPFQYIYGTGVLVSTATGSTAYNLSAHGPIVSPDLRCLIITELFDHNLPTPSIVLSQDKEVNIKIVDFRHDDVVLVIDGNDTQKLQKNDIIRVKLSNKFLNFAEIEDSYFLKSLHEKFAFK